MTVMSAGLSLSSIGRDGRPIPPEIIAAARRCFLHYGVSRATVTDIATEVGTPRQSLYEHVTSKNELIVAAMIQRIAEIAEDLRPLVPVDAEFTSAFEKVGTAAITKARADRELMNFFETGPSAFIRSVVAGPSNEIHDVVKALLAPVLDRGAETGMLRTDQSRDEIIDWIRFVFLSLITQEDLDDAGVVALISNFLLPSLMFSTADRTPDPSSSSAGRPRRKRS
jgi:AcrR family transcriptional regulator